ncbi:hypothetical protein T484DRAFT_1945496 [Baffinella frigidus]|nr:hypothetical protein T484DRAFT_1945496 [Cryptophyta sp. CCMP2293]
MMEDAISVQDLGFNWPDGSRALTSVSMGLPKGCRSVLVGANGAGKTCLLRCVGGMYKYSGECRVFGKETYVPTRLGTSGAFEIVAGTNCWRHGNCTIVGERWQPRGDSKVSTMLEFVDGWEPARRDILVERFGIDLDWQTLLEWLREESETRGVTVLFSTHIFDGLEDWGTHVTYVQEGKISRCAALGEVPEIAALRTQGCLTPLYNYVETMVNHDADIARASGGKKKRLSEPVGLMATN